MVSNVPNIMLAHLTLSEINPYYINERKGDDVSRCQHCPWHFILHFYFLEIYLIITTISYNSPKYKYNISGGRTIFVTWQQKSRE